MTRGWLDTTHTTRTTRKGRVTMVYGVRGEFVDVRHNGDPHIISTTALLPLQYDTFEPRRGRLGVTQCFTSRVV